MKVPSILVIRYVSIYYKTQLRIKGPKLLFPNHCNGTKMHNLRCSILTVQVTEHFSYHIKPVHITYTVVQLGEIFSL